MKKTTLLMLSFLFNLSLFAQNYSLDFDGTDDYLDMSSIPASFEYSFEMWFKLDAVTFDTRIVTASSTHNNIYSVALLAGDKLHVSIGGGGAPVAATSTSILPNTWYHIAFIRKSSTEVDFYLNGVQEVTTINIDPSIEWVDEMRLASPFVLNGNPNGLYMDGQIDEFRVWNGSRTAGQIFEHYQREVSGLEFGLNTNYKFDDNASPNDVEDCHNSGTHGVRFGSGGSNNLPQFVTDQPTGLYDIDCLDLVIGCVEESIIDMPIGDSEDNYGNNVGITTDRFIVGVPNDYVDFDKQGSAIINDWDGSNWIETKLTSDSSSYNSQFGYSVDVDGDRAIVGAHFNDVNGVAQVGAAYIYDWDGAMWNETQLVASDGEYYDGFGYDVAIDGDRAVVSAKWDDDQGSTSGSVYVFDYDGTNWIESHKLNQGSYQAGPQFGEDVDLDGDRLVVGAPKYDHSGYNQAGRAYIFDYNGSSWVRTMLQAYDPFNYDAYGTGVSVSGDRVVVGAHADDDAGTSSGSIYVYTYNGSSWNVEKVLGMNIGAFAFFGYNISIDGDRMVVGAYGDLGREGKAIILDWNGSSWDQEEIFASDGSHYDHFGWSVALLGDQCVIGAYFDHLNGANDAGSCYVLTLASGTWGEEKVTESSPISNGQFGNAIAVNGNRMVVGSPYLNDWFGEVSIYDWDGSAWVFTETLTSSAPHVERFGEAVSVQGDRIIVGAPWRSNTKGRVYIYDYDGTNWVETYFDGVGNPRFGWEVSSFGDRFVVGAPRDNDNGTYAGAIHIYDWDGTMWVETKLTPTDAATQDEFGTDVELLNDRILVGAPKDDDNGTNSGSVYVYDWNGSTWVETKITTSDGTSYDEFGSSVDLADDKLIVGAYRDTTNGTWSGSAYIYEWDGSSWAETKLIASDVEPFDEYGLEVAILGDRAIVGAPKEGVDGNNGAIYVYDFDGTTWNETKMEASDSAAGALFGYAIELLPDQYLVGNRSKYNRVYDFFCPGPPVFCDEMTADIDTTIVPLDTLSDYIFAVEDWVKLTGNFSAGSGADTFIDVRASQYIELNPSFTVELGTRALFEIAPCDNTLITLAKEEEEGDVVKRVIKDKPEDPEEIKVLKKD